MAVYATPVGSSIHIYIPDLLHLQTLTQASLKLSLVMADSGWNSVINSRDQRRSRDDELREERPEGLEIMAPPSWGG